jgi:hypothetical protein
MKHQILLLAVLVAALSSCTTAYKTGQTPDDVYYSPARPQDEYVRVDDGKDEYRYDDEYYDDRYLRMKVHNRTRWDYLNDWYSYDRYGYRYNYYYGSWNNPYNAWNYYYNPYCPNTVVVNPKQPVQNNYVKPRNFNVSAYTNNNFNNNNNNTNVKTKPGTVSRPVYNNSNNNSNRNGFSNTVKQIFSSGNNNSNNNNTYSPPARTYTPSAPSNNSSGNSSGNSGSSGGSGGGVSRPSRGGGN